MKKIIYFSLVIIFGCQNSTNELKSNLNQLEFRSIELIDTFSNPLLFENACSITEAEFHPMYMGIIKDSIFLNYNSREIEYKNYHWNKYRRPDPNNLIIYIDTLQTIGSVKRHIVPPPPPPGYKGHGKFKELNKVSRGETKSYPVYIKNITKDTLIVGYGIYIPLVIEAKDSLGKWRPIQEPYNYFCGTGLNNYYLPPNEIILNSCKLFQGDYKTKMRLSFGYENTSKSNEFVGYMNYEQFDESLNKYY